MTFDTAFDMLIGHEGGYTEGHGDPGGETNWGISKRAYPLVDVKNLTREGAKEIYLRDFWGKLPDVHPTIQFHLFDFAVNSGLSAALRVWKTVPQTGDHHQQVLYLSAERLAFMTRLKNWPIAGKGWARRIADNLRFAASQIA